MRLPAFGQAMADASGAEIGQAVGGAVRPVTDPNSFLSTLKQATAPDRPSLFGDAPKVEIPVQFPTADDFRFDPTQFLNPLQISIADDVAGQVKNRTAGETAMKRAFAGESLADQAYADKLAAQQSEEQAHMAAAQQVAAQTMDLDDKQFQELMDRLKTEMGTVPAPPMRGGPEMPNNWQLLAGLVGSILDPAQSAEIAASPFQSKLIQEARDFQNKQAEYEADLAARGERIKMLQMEAGQVHDRMVTNQKIRADQQQSEADRQNRLAIAETAAKSRENIAMLKEGSSGERNLLKLIADDRTDPQTRADYIGLLREGNPNKYGGFSDQDISDYAARLTPTQQLQGAQQGLAESRTALTDAKTQTENAMREANKQMVLKRTELYTSQIKLNGERAKMVAEVTKHLDDESAVKVALGWRQIDNLDSLMNDREFSQELDKIKNNRQVLDDIRKPIKEALDQWHKTAEDLRDDREKKLSDRRKLELAMPNLDDDTQVLADKQIKAIDAEIAEIDKQIRNAQAQYGAMQKKAEGLGSRLEGQIMIKAPTKTGKSGNKPVILNGPIKGKK